MPPVFLLLLHRRRQCACGPGRAGAAERVARPLSARICGDFIAGQAFLDQHPASRLTEFLTHHGGGFHGCPTSGAAVWQISTPCSPPGCRALITSGGPRIAEICPAYRAVKSPGCAVGMPAAARTSLQTACRLPAPGGALTGEHRKPAECSALRQAAVERGFRANGQPGPSCAAREATGGQGWRQIEMPGW